MNTADHFKKLTNMMLKSPFNRQFDRETTVRKGYAVFTVHVDKSHYLDAGGVHGSLYFLALGNVGHQFYHH